MEKGYSYCNNYWANRQRLTGWKKIAIPTVTTVLGVMVLVGLVLIK